jgi:methyl-accepting chemotaxis protein
MKMKLKTKTTLGSAAFLLILTIISTVTVSIIINKQNLEASHDLLKKSFTLINEFVSERQNKLLIDSRQMATINDMGGTVRTLIDNKKTFLYVMLRTNYAQIAESLYNNSINTNIQKAVIYDMDGNLMAFSMSDDEGSLLGFIHDEDNIETAFIKPGENFNYELWKKQASLSNIDSKFVGDVPTKETIRFENINDSINLVTYIPIISVVYKSETAQDEQKQYGFVTAIQALDSQFLEKLSRLAGTAINIFTNKGLSIGNLKEYTDFDLSVFGKIDGEWSMDKQEILFNLIKIDNKGYFQGILPIYFGSDCIAAIVSLHSEDIAKANTWQMINLLILVSIVCILVLLPITVIFSNSMTKPIIKVVTGLKDVAEGEGDLTARLDIKNKDEVGDLSHWFNTFVDNLQRMIRNIAGNAETLHRSSSELSNLSERMSENSGEMSVKANSVAASSEEMSANMNSVAAAMEEASTNVGMVATSAEEMTATINEIARNSEKAQTITSEAVSRAQDASAKVDELGNAAKEIGKVTEAITEISAQTNLLALNATIEAARAGEAGKGFSVVANEIKELARQTAEATQEIKGQISGIQTSTSGTVSEIEEILKVINDVNEIVATIATAVGEQSLTTKEIAKNISQASKGIQEVNENVAQSSSVSTEIAKEITDVNQAAGEMSNSSSQMNLSTSELSKLAEELKALVSRFKV